MLQLIVLILTLSFDAYIAEKYNKKYNVTQNSIFKYKELNMYHKRKVKWTTSISLPVFLLIGYVVPYSGVDKIIEIVTYCTTAYFIMLAIWDLYYQKDKINFKLALKRNIYAYSFAIIMFVILFSVNN